MKKPKNIHNINAWVSYVYYLEGILNDIIKKKILFKPKRPPHEIAIEILIFLVIGLVAVSIMYTLQGVKGSLSEYAFHKNTVYIFKLWLLSVALGMYRNKTLRLACIPAVLVAVFNASNVNQITNIIHNVSAGMFLIAVIVSLYKKNRKISSLLMASILLYPMVGLYYGELISISILYVYYINIMIRVMNSKHKSLQ